MVFHLIFLQLWDGSEHDMSQMSSENICEHRLRILRPVVQQVSDWGSDSGGAFGSVHWVRVGDAAIEAAAVAEEAAADSAVVRAKQGDPIAARSVGLRLMEGTSQHGHNTEAAAEAWNEEAEANDPESMNNLGVLYQKGTKSTPPRKSFACILLFQQICSLGTSWCAALSRGLLLEWIWS